MIFRLQIPQKLTDILHSQNPTWISENARYYDEQLFLFQSKDYETIVLHTVEDIVDDLVLVDVLHLPRILQRLRKRISVKFILRFVFQIKFYQCPRPKLQQRSLQSQDHRKYKIAWYVLRQNQQGSTENRRVGSLCGYITTLLELRLRTYCVNSKISCDSLW